MDYRILFGIIFGNFQARKKSTKINFLGLETAGWGGGLPREGVPREGVRVEKFVPSLESLSSLGFEGGKLGCPGNFAGILGVFKKFVQKSSCAFFVPKISVKELPNRNCFGINSVILGFSGVEWHRFDIDSTSISCP